MADVFISYEHRDHEYARRLASAIEENGYSCWWDRNLIAGSEFASAIDRELREASAVIVIWSQNSNGSNWVRDEADEALRQNKLVPVTFDGSLPPLGFRQVLAVDLSRDNEQSQIERVLAGIALLTRPHIGNGQIRPKAIKNTQISHVLRSNADGNLRDRIRAPGPKRILAIDGGGVRTVIGMMFLKQLEEILKSHARDAAAFRLSDYFDLIAGTSHGGVVACLLATGHSMDEVLHFSLRGFEATLGSTMAKLGVLFRPERTKRIIRDQIDDAFGDIRLGGGEMKTGVAMFVKRIDTNTTWTVTNSPFAHFYDPPGGLAHTKPMKDMRLADFAIAGISIPPLIKSQTIEVAKDLYGVFVDGVLGPYASPALGAFLAVRSPIHGFGWATGAENLTIVSVGSGIKTFNPELKAKRNPRLRDAAFVLGGGAVEASEFGQIVMQTLGAPATDAGVPHHGAAVSDLQDQSGSLFRFRRYDVEFTQEWMAQNCGLDFTKRELKRLSSFYQVDNVPILREIGAAAAERQISGADCI